MANTRLAGTAAALLLAAILAAVLAGCGPGQAKGTAVAPHDGVFRLDVSGIKGGEVRFFNYATGGKSVVFFVARTQGGEIRTAFDACITCYPHKMGYRLEAGSVVCVKCGTAFGLDELGRGKGNCVPIAIEHRLDGDGIVIDEAVIISGARWF